MRTFAILILAGAVATSLPVGHDPVTPDEVPARAPVPAAVRVDAALVSAARSAGFLLASGKVAPSRRPSVLATSAALLDSAQYSLSAPLPGVPDDRVQTARDALAAAAPLVAAAASCGSPACESAQSAAAVSEATGKAGRALAALAEHGSLTPRDLSAAAAAATRTALSAAAAPGLTR
jgi:hypothetical protein